MSMDAVSSWSHRNSASAVTVRSAAIPRVVEDDAGAII